MKHLFGSEKVSMESFEQGILIFEMRVFAESRQRLGEIAKLRICNFWICNLRIRNFVTYES